MVSDRRLQAAVVITTAHVYLTRAQKKRKRRHARREAHAGVKPPEHARGPGNSLGSHHGEVEVGAPEAGGVEGLAAP